MKYLIPFCGAFSSLIFSNLVFAKPIIVVEENPPLYEKALYLKSDLPPGPGLVNEIKETLGKLDTWTQMVDKRTPPFLNLNKYPIDITDHVPTFVKTQYLKGSTYERSGYLFPDADDPQEYKPYPNCFNTVLVLSGLETTAKFTGPDEFMDSLKAHCHELNQNEMPELGDIGLVNGYYVPDQTSGPSHAYIYLTPSIIFQKTGATASKSPYELNSEYGAIAYKIDYAIWNHPEESYTAFRISPPLNPANSKDIASDNSLTYYTYYRCSK